MVPTIRATKELTPYVLIKSVPITTLALPEIGFNITKLVISLGIPKILNTQIAISAIKSINPEALSKLTDKKSANNVGNKFKTVCSPSITPSENESKTFTLSLIPTIKIKQIRKGIIKLSTFLLTICSP